jgi:hypothetical protein
MVMDHLCGGSMCSDKKGRILAVKEDGKNMPTIVRYRVEIIRNK